MPTETRTVGFRVFLQRTEHCGLLRRNVLPSRWASAYFSPAMLWIRFRVGTAAQVLRVGFRVYPQLVEISLGHGGLPSIGKWASEYAEVGLRVDHGGSPRMN